MPDNILRRGAVADMVFPRMTVSVADYAWRDGASVNRHPPYTIEWDVHGARRLTMESAAV